MLPRCRVALQRYSVRRCSAPRWRQRQYARRLWTATSSTPAAVSSAGVPSLVSWIEANGGSCSKLYLKHSELAGRAVYCRTTIGADERIVRIPKKLLLSTADCKQSDVGRLVDQASKPFTNAQSYIAAFILQERQRGASSFFHPFLASLPTSFASFPLLYSDAQLSLLRGSQVLDSVEAQRSDIHSDYLTLMAASPPFSLTLDNFYAARLAVGSRVFGARLSGDESAESDAVLVPYMDLLNHSEQHHIHWSYEPAVQQFTCRSLVPIEPAAEVTTTYGSRCNSTLLAHYGFALDSNDNNECQLQFGLRAVGSESEALRLSKVRVLDGMEGELAERMKWRLEAGHSVELEKLLSYLRLCEADEAEMWSLDDAGTTRAERVKAVPVLGADNESKVWRSVASETRRRIAEFAALSEYEQRMSTSRAGSIERLCALTCASELRVLLWLARLADVCAEALAGAVSAVDAEAALRQLSLLAYWKTLQPLLEQAGRRKQFVRQYA